MADNKKKKSSYTAEDSVGRVQISDQVVSVISGIAATEVEGVASLVGNITNELVSRMGIKNLSKGVKTKMDGIAVEVMVTLNLIYGYNVPDVCIKVQERVASSIETMTGLKAKAVNVRVADITVAK